MIQFRREDLPHEQYVFFYIDVFGHSLSTKQPWARGDEDDAIAKEAFQVRFVTEANRPTPETMLSLTNVKWKRSITMGPSQFPVLTFPRSSCGDVLIFAALPEPRAVHRLITAPFQRGALQICSSELITGSSGRFPSTSRVWEGSQPKEKMKVRESWMQFKGNKSPPPLEMRTNCWDVWVFQSLPLSSFDKYHARFHKVEVLKLELNVCCFCLLETAVLFLRIRDTLNHITQTAERRSSPSFSVSF